MAQDETSRYREEPYTLLLVRTSVHQSPIHGLGLFADEPIETGTVLWRFEPLLDQVIDERDLADLHPAAVGFLDVYSEYFPELGVLVLSGDNDRYTNHSDDPNTEVVLPNGPRAIVRAVRDIAAGEEITCDYHQIRCRAHSFAAPAVKRSARRSRANEITALPTPVVREPHAVPVPRASRASRR